MRRKYVGDFAWTASANLLFAIATQIVAYPALSRIMTVSDYGVLLSLVAIVNSVAVTLGSSLNNSLLVSSGGAEERVSGEFTLLAVFLLPCGGVLVSVLASLVFGLAIGDVLAAGIICIFVALRSYLNVAFRIRLQFGRTFGLYFLAALGYALGAWWAVRIGVWWLPFVVGEGLALAFLVPMSLGLIKKRSSAQWRASLKLWSGILAASAVTSTLPYVDRFLLLALMDGTAVAVFVVAATLGKLVVFGFVPVTSVLLTHAARATNLSRSDIRKAAVYSLALAGIATFALSLLGSPVLRLLYPDIFQASREFIPIASAGACLMGATAVLQALVTRFCNWRVNMVVQVVTIFFYLCSSAVGISLLGLLGFCWATVLVAGLRFGFQYFSLALYVRGAESVHERAP